MHDCDFFCFLEGKMLICYFCDQNYFVIFATLGIAQASLALRSLIAKINQKSRAVLKNAKV
jgi:hypothetical protein